jgi:WXG100 family type VII secretion target
MTDTGNKAHDAAAQLKGTLSRLLNELAPLESAWKGLAAGSFGSVKNRYQQDMDKLHAALEGLANALGATNVTYSTTDSDNNNDVNAAGADAGNITSKLQLL